MDIDKKTQMVRAAVAESERCADLAERFFGTGIVGFVVAIALLVIGIAVRDEATVLTATTIMWPAWGLIFTAHLYVRRADKSIQEAKRIKNGEQKQ